jgi:hypothetical protein
MSWIQKELKRRKRKLAPATAAGGPSAEALRALRKKRLWLF